ncbi:EAL domain-containing protein [Sulfoacidibacillus ferrooxidans]|nr:EAL domain-containing protein [Sulfoacidibacillus ferrooxidans]
MCNQDDIKPTVQNGNHHFYRSDSMDDSMYVREVLEAGSMYTVYQPIVNHSKQMVFAHEALSRPFWQDSALAPDRWFQASVVEECSMAADMLAVRTAFTHFKSDALHQKRLFVNVMPTSLLDISFMNFFERALDVYHMDPTQLVIEIIEYVSYIPSELAPICNVLRSSGIQFALDDVSHECSAKELLLKLDVLQPEYIKIDRSLIHGVAHNLVQQKRLRSLLDRVTSSKYVIAEGVESQADMEWLKMNGVQLSQGYYWSKPLCMSEIVYSQNCEESTLTKGVGTAHAGLLRAYQNVHKYTKEK